MRSVGGTVTVTVETRQATTRPAHVAMCSYKVAAAPAQHTSPQRERHLTRLPACVPLSPRPQQPGRLARPRDRRPRQQPARREASKPLGPNRRRWRRRDMSGDRATTLAIGRPAVGFTRRRHRDRPARPPGIPVQSLAPTAATVTATTVNRQLCLAARVSPLLADMRLEMCATGRMIISRSVGLVLISGRHVECMPV